VAVEKLILTKCSEISSHQDALQATSSTWVDIFYPQICGCFLRKRLFQHPLAKALIEKPRRRYTKRWPCQRRCSRCRWRCRPLAPIQCAEAQTSTLAKLDKLGHQLLNFRTGTSLGGRQLFFCSHPDSSTQAPLVEQVCWSDAYAERQHSGKCYDGGLNCLVLRVSLHSCPESVPLRFLLSYSR
jgi:hypothetical protein